MNTKVVLITGASAGIGLELAKILMEQAWIVYAGSRRGGNSAKHDSGGCIIPVKMDVNDEVNIRSTIEHIIAENGHLDAVVCNAGNGVAGAIEDTNTAEVHYQLETNFFGAVKTIQACLSVFRRQGFGKIMATSSVAAIVPLPFQAFYSAGKSALLTLMNALSLEVKSFGIQCCTVLPGDTKTEFTSARKYSEKSQNPSSPYYPTLKKSIGRMEKDEQNGMSAHSVANRMARELMREKMKPIVVPGWHYRLICWAFGWLPFRFKMWVVGLLYG